MGTNHARFGILLLVFGAVGLLGWYFVAPWIDDLYQQATSDAKSARETIRIGTDSWVGYFPLCSQPMKERLRKEGYRLKCEDDGANYAARMAALRSRTLDFAVATVDSYLIAGARENFPGTIVLVIDESKGGDAAVARKDRIRSIDDLKSGRDFKIALTPGSPSEYLLKAIGVHFDIPKLYDRKGAWRVEASGSADALQKLTSGAVDAAVVWEPDVSRALADPSIGKVLSTADTRRLIVDVLVVNRELSGEQPETVQRLLAAYFQTLKHYREHPAELRDDVAAATRSSKDQADAMLRGVSWYNLETNADEWLGVRSRAQLPRQGIVDAIESTLAILIEAGDFTKNPLPHEDPYRIVFSEPVAKLIEGGVLGKADAEGRETEDSLARRFPPLDESGWNALREVGTLRVRPITFQSGTGELSLDGKRELDKAADSLKHYPNFRLVVEGHSAQRGDADENRVLSERRAEAVARYLEVTYGIDENRLRPVGKGSSEPLPQKPGETARAYGYRLPRVEMYLVTDVY